MAMGRGGFNHIGEETLTVNTVAVAFASPPNGRVPHALVWCSGGPIRWRADGTAPTSTAGMFVPANSYIEWTDPDYDYASFINTVKFIRDTTSTASATLEIAYLS